MNRPLAFFLKVISGLSVPALLIPLSLKEGDKLLISLLLSVLALVVIADLMLASKVIRVVFVAYPAAVALAALAIRVYQEHAERTSQA